ncbi:hypothetical protein EJ05DRAFT_290645 [Pseudovirgaria hyperparasitica]|uniref:protein O-GlcNAc transferase n=1 Tax=Pseudovirgaria hyperparasitica TaxID=470096 RepID=A0A6A6WCQ3_9PEZI|nr:uncharacterized protein EJ05DRAFT_290645 [Pseudovirgaria hyperparasitica]KAF2760608.1 hypothetical protein EJ05DRAFT_290645 [Pseudovirgaria hyperparasitica]
MTMIRPYPRQPQFNQHPYPTDLHCNSLPPSPLQSTHQDTTRDEQFSRRWQRLPQQYAHPLQRTNSYPQPGGGNDARHSEVVPSEHLLRRKTPNGIISAAYDGTSVEQMGRPHAMKHILLPVTSHDGRNSGPAYNNYTLHKDLPVKGHGSTHLDESSQSNHIIQTRPNTWNADMTLAPHFTNNNWNRMQLNLPQIDSMLNQMPSQHAQMRYQPLYGAFQPSVQSPVGPTASGEQLPYGPYWPNGTFIPYRPAAIRDPRFYSNATPPWTGYPSHGAPQQNVHFNQRVQHHNSDNYLSQSVNLDRNVYPGDPASSFHFNTGNSQNHLAYPNNFLPPQPQQSSQTFHLLSPGSAQDQFQYSDSGHSIPHARNFPAQDVLAEFGPHSSNADMREKVFTWAHSIYIDLLKYLQQTKRHASHQRTNNHNSARSNWHPKPPRQPDANFASLPVTRKSLDGKTSQNYMERHRDAQIQAKLSDKYRTLRRSSGATVARASPPNWIDTSTPQKAASAMEILSRVCNESSWQWIDGMLLVGCLAYALSNYEKATEWYRCILELDSNNVEAMSNLAATLLALGRKQEAEDHWLKAIRLRPSYFEAVEHLIGLFCGDHRTNEAVKCIESIERALRYARAGDALKAADDESNDASSLSAASEESDQPVFDYDFDNDQGLRDAQNLPGSELPGFGSSGYAIAGRDNGRMLALVHAKGNMLYALGDNVGAAKAFDNAVMIGAGRKIQGITGLIVRILDVVGKGGVDASYHVGSSTEPILLPPDKALDTARLCFPSQGDLPGLKHVPAEGLARKAAISTTSNSLLSLAKIFQDGMAANSSKATAYQANYGVREILALYYLSLSLQPSPSTANNVGILLASVQQTVAHRQPSKAWQQNMPEIPGITPGSGIALALMYYNYGLKLDSKHAHLYTNLGSLLKDIGQLGAAIQMYEMAVAHDGTFDIALANLANAVKDQGRIADAITYYKRAVHSSPDFAEAVCGLANALNSVCGWTGRGGIAAANGARDRWHVNDKGMLLDATQPGAVSTGWIKRVVDLVEKQLGEGESWGTNVIDAPFTEEIVAQLAYDGTGASDLKDAGAILRATLKSWCRQKWEGARVVRLVERAIRRLGWRWYHDIQNEREQQGPSAYKRPRLPSALTIPAAPTVLPFHTFTCPMSAKQIRLISQRNGLRISTSTLKAPWLPSTVYPPPSPPHPYIKVGYVSSDFNNHPLAHLMQSVFGLHDRKKVKAYCYATTASDNSVHRHQIEKEAPVFHDAHDWTAEKLVKQIISDGIHILVNLNGYTRGARNEVFAARPAPVHMSFMGFAGTLGAEWCDYLLADEMAVPLDTLRPWRRNVTIQDQLVDENSGGDEDDWVYGENIVFCRDTFFCCDHRQSAPDAKEPQLSWEDEQVRRWTMRKEIFPHLPDDTIILGNFNQLYKIEPTTFRTWLRILAALPRAILWLLRFPDLGETHLRATATAWAGPEVAARIQFTDVAPKHQHISRARVCDLFLDTPECNAHTTAADVLWSGTPLITFPRYKYKMCSRMAASILKGALPKNDDGKRAAKDLIMSSEEEYEEKAKELISQCHYEGHRLRGRLSDLRKTLYEARWSSALFDTKRWVRDLEQAYEIVWKKWERGEGGDVWLDEKRVQELA